VNGMRKGTRTGFPAGLLLPVIAAAVLLCFLTGVSNLTRDRAEEDKRQLEQAVRRAAVACYAAEGIYPPDLEYLEQHYGLQVNRTSYTVIYESYGSNMMPDITVLENEI